MKKFDLELAKQGYPVVTRNGRSARIICFNAKNTTYPIVALVTTEDTKNESVEIYTNSGKYRNSNIESSQLDLMMVCEKYEGWINIYKDISSSKTFPGCYIYNSEQDAKKASEDISSDSQYVATIKIEWED